MTIKKMVNYNPSLKHCLMPTLHEIYKNYWMVRAKYAGTS